MMNDHAHLRIAHLKIGPRGINSYVGQICFVLKNLVPMHHCLIITIRGIVGCCTLKICKSKYNFKMCTKPAHFTCLICLTIIS